MAAIDSPVTAAPAPVKEIAVEAFDGEAVTAADTSVTTGQTALSVLATPGIKGRAPRPATTATSSARPGPTSTATAATPATTSCAATSTASPSSRHPRLRRPRAARSHDPYTGRGDRLRRGRGTSTAVQIDHVVALGRRVAEGRPAAGRTRSATAFANDPLNLLAVDGPPNMQKGDGDAATWLPPARRSGAPTSPGRSR